MANVNVTYQQMHEAAARLTGGQQEIEGNLSQLQSLVEQLVAGGYVTDSSSQHFAQAYAEFTTGARNAVAGLSEMARYLATAAATFADADDQLASALHR